MKTKFTLLMALAGLLSLNVNAQETPPRPGGPGGRGTGRFQPDAETIKKYDKDGDGQLSEEERATLRADRDKEREKAMLEKYDADKNGKLDEAETKKMNDENPRGRGGPGGPGGRGTFPPATPEEIKTYDKNADGKLEGDEATALRDARQKARMEKYDADKDGKLSDDERQKMMDDYRKLRPEGTRPGGGGRGASEETKPEPAKAPVPETK